MTRVSFIRYGIANPLAVDHASLTGAGTIKSTDQKVEKYVKSVFGARDPFRPDESGFEHNEDFVAKKAKAASGRGGRR